MTELRYDLNEDTLKKIIDKISELTKAKKINYSVVNNEFKITKDQYYYALYQYLLKSGNVKKEPDEELLIKISSSEKFRDIELPYEERSEFLSFVILYVNKEFGTTFKEQILKITNSEFHLDYFQIQHEFSKALPQMKISKVDLIQILNHFAKCAENDMTVGEVYTSCREYCSKNPDKGWELLLYMIEKKEVNFLSQALMGLSTSDFKKTIEEIEKLIETEYKPQALFALGYLDYNKKEEDLKNILGLFEKAIEDPDQAVRLAIVKALTNILNMPFVIEFKVDDRILAMIKILLKEKEPNSLYSVLMGMSIFSRKHGHNFLQDILEYYYDVDLKYKGIIRDLALRLADLNSPVILFDFLQNWIEYHDEIDAIKEFSYPLREMYKKHPMEYIEIYIHKIIDNKARIRNIFKTQFGISKLSDSNRKVWLENIAKLDIEQKIHFFISLNDNMPAEDCDVEDKLGLAYLTLNFHDEKLYKYLFSASVSLIMDYCGMIDEIISRTIDKSNQLHLKFYTEFKKHYDDFINTWNQKEKILELDPILNQSRLLRKYNEIYLKRQSELIAGFKSEDTPILDMFKKVQIGRGKSIKFSTDTEPTELQLIQHSFVLPRSMFVYPEAYNYNMNLRNNEDWE